MTTLPIHRVEHVVSDEEIDALGHANNVAYVRWMIEAATSHSAALGWDFDAYARLGAFWIVRRHEIDYLLPAKRGDRIAVHTWVADFRAAQSLRRYEIRLPDGRTCARGATNWAFVDAATGRPTRVPPEVRSAFTPVGDDPDLPT